VYVGTLLKVTVERKKRDNETFSAVTLNIYEQQCNVGKKTERTIYIFFIVGWRWTSQYFK